MNIRKKQVIEATTKRKVLQGKGEEYSAVALEIEQTFYNWLNASEISEAAFLNLVDKDDFSLILSDGKESVIVSFLNGEEEIAVPLVWKEGNEISFEAYRTDLALLLFFVEGKCKNPKSKEKIKLFVKDKIIAK